MSSRDAGDFIVFLWSIQSHGVLSLLCNATQVEGWHVKNLGEI
jgi:hypothetical protein